MAMSHEPWPAHCASSGRRHLFPQDQDPWDKGVIEHFHKRDKESGLRCCCCADHPRRQAGGVRQDVEQLERLVSYQVPEHVESAGLWRVYFMVKTYFFMCEVCEGNVCLRQGHVSDMQLCKDALQVSTLRDDTMGLLF